jgi:hypothetical protein
MLTYDDCVGLSGLTSEEIDAIARQAHLPEIVALEMASCLCATAAGEQAIRRMISAEIEAAHARGDRRAVARLWLVLHHFTLTHPSRPAAADAATGLPHAEPADDDPDHAMRALGLDTTTAPWVRARVDAHLTAMLRQFGLDPVAVQDRFRAEMRQARTRCAACAETARCRRFLAGAAGSEPPSAFCPNAPLLDRLRRRSPRSTAAGTAGG